MFVRGKVLVFLVTLMMTVNKRYQYTDTELITEYSREYSAKLFCYTRAVSTGMSTEQVMCT